MEHAIAAAKSAASVKAIESLPSEIKDFYNFHGVQMVGSDFPASLIQRLHEKLSTQTYDISEFVEIVDNEAAETFEVKAKADLGSCANVFVVDHAVTFRYPDLRQLLSENPAMVGRLEAMLKYLRKPL